MISIGGFQKLSLVNYPGKTAAVVFLNGCPFRCRFCFNPALVRTPYARVIAAEDVLRDLRMFHWGLDGVVVTGGEPCMQPDLPDFLTELKLMGFPVKLDTCGYFPEVLSSIIGGGLVDYVAMDIKAPFEKYSNVVQIKVEDARLRKSIQVILDSGVAHEFRSTLVSGLHEAEDVRCMARQISGASAYYLQPFRAQMPLMDPTYSARTAPPMEEMKREVMGSGSRIGVCAIRN